MGAGAAKAHQVFRVAPARASGREGAGPSAAIHFRDDRPPGSASVRVEQEAMAAALEAAGVVVGPGTRIRLRLREQTHPGQQGLAQRIGPDRYRVVIHVAPKERLEDRHLYVLNNSLLHELRHVAQMQGDPEHGAKYLHQNLTVGYTSNAYEVEARYYGRLADHTGTKDTGPLGPAPGKQLWGLRAAPRGESP